MNNDIFIEISTVFLKKSIETLEPWNIDNPHRFLEQVVSGLKSVYYVFRFINVDDKTNTEIVEILENTIIHFLQFMKQISDEDVTFLQLSSKDASLFVYKKLLFNLKPSIATTTVNLEAFPSKDLYDKMMSFFSLITENDFIVNGNIHDNDWWKTTFVDEWLTHMKET